MTVRGTGGYFADAGRALGGMAGGALGGMGDTLFGLGAYEVKKNSLLNNGSLVIGQGVPRVINTKKGEATVFNHKEYFGELTSGAFPVDTTFTGFNLQTLACNPGNPDLFPWLALEAQGFQEYEIHGAIVELVTETADFSNNFTVGSIFMAAEYNPQMPPPSNKTKLLELEYSNSVKSSCNLIMPIECARRNDVQTHLFVALNGNYNGTDPRMYDLCNIFVGSQGLPAENAKIAEMYITYEIWLYKPMIPSAPPVGNGAKFQFTAVSGNPDVMPPFFPYQPFGLLPFAESWNNPDIKLVLSPGPGDVERPNRIVLPSGDSSWLIEYHYIQYQPGAVVASPSAKRTTSLVPDVPQFWDIQPGGSAQFYTGWSSSLGHNLVPTVQVAATNPDVGFMVQSFVVKTVGGGVPFVDFIGTTFDTTLNLGFGDLFICQLPNVG